jgi:hypothetical protein
MTIMLRLFNDDLIRFFWQPGLMLLTQTLNHVDQIAILAIQLIDAFLVALEASDADFVAPRQLMLVLFKVFCNFFRVMLVEETDGAYGGGAFDGNRGRRRHVATGLSANWIGERRTFGAPTSRAHSRCRAARGSE